MNRSRLLMIGGLAVVLGLLVSYTVYNRLRTSAGSSNEAGIEVVVAANDIQVGAKLEDRDIRLARFPQSVIPPGAVTKKSQVMGRGVVLPVSKGEFILPSKLAAANAGAGLPSLIPPGMRAVSVRVNDVVSVAGFVQPGSRVDVLATGNPANGNDRQTTTVLENVAVIAVGKSLERSATGESQSAPVITLLVAPDDAQRLTLASQEGRIQLALRNPLDTRKEQIGATRASSLYPGAAPPVTQAKPRTHKPTIPVTVIPSSAYAVETIRGSKRDETKF
ncbi:MAG: Flp pilus assembly protein CpaB [Terriglobales bacterium]